MPRTDDDDNENEDDHNDADTMKNAADAVDNVARDESQKNARIDVVVAMTQSDKTRVRKRRSTATEESRLEKKRVKSNTKKVNEQQQQQQGSIEGQEKMENNTEEEEEEASAISSTRTESNEMENTKKSRGLNNLKTNNIDNDKLVTYLLEQGRAGPDGTVIPTQLQITLTGQDGPLRLQLGDDVLVSVEDDNEACSCYCCCARIVSFRQQQKQQQDNADPDDDDDDDDDQGLVFTAQWFLNQRDIGQLPISVPWKGPLTRSELLQQMGSSLRNIVLSNETDENDIGSILGLAPIQFLKDDQHYHHREPEPEQEDVSTSGVYFCKYRLEISPREMKLEPYVSSVSTGIDGERDGQFGTENPTARTTEGEGEEDGDDEGDEEQEELEEELEETNSGFIPDGESDVGSGGELDTTSSKIKVMPRGTVRSVVVEGEGSVLRESIEVGPNYQATVPAWVPPGVPPRSRHPQLIWKPGWYSDEQLAQFLQQVASAHTPFLERNQLGVSNVAYTPVLDPAALNQMLQHRPERLTGSSLSTSSMLAGLSHRAALRKECDPDELLLILAESQGNLQQAIDTAVSDLDRISRGAWTLREKALYEEGFRRHGTTLRPIAKALAPTKSYQDVVDFHFRCKIPDQFRMYQEKKREIAVRIVECLEGRRSNPSPPMTSTTTTTTTSVTPPEGHWSEISVAEVGTVHTGARRLRARDFLTRVQEQLGDAGLAKLAHWMRNYPNQPQAARKQLLATLDPCPELKKQLAAHFLPPWKKSSHK